MLEVEVSMRAKCLPLYLPSDIYAELERRGQAAERDPIQEARFIIKQAIGAGALQALPATDPTNRTPAGVAG
jgi:hypothetical protein